MSLTVLPVLLAGYAAVCLFLYWQQEALLFFPEQAPLATVSREAQHAGFRLWPEATADYRAVLAEPAGTTAVGTCLIWHGNAGSARQRGYLAEPFVRLGWRVVVAEYPGYGARLPGSLREAALTTEAKALARDVRRQFAGPVVVVGESLGAAIAAAVAGDPELAVTGVMLFTPWLDLAGAARTHYPWLPARLLLRDPFDNAAALRDFRGPVLVVTAGSDEVIPARQGQSLFQTLTTPDRRLHEIPGARHNDWTERVAADEWREWLGFASGRN